MAMNTCHLAAIAARLGRTIKQGNPLLWLGLRMYHRWLFTAPADPPERNLFQDVEP